MKIRPVGTSFSMRTDGRTDGRPYGWTWRS